MQRSNPKALSTIVESELEDEKETLPIAGDCLVGGFHLRRGNSLCSCDDCIIGFDHDNVSITSSASTTSFAVVNALSPMQHSLESFIDFDSSSDTTDSDSDPHSDSSSGSDGAASFPATRAPSLSFSDDDGDDCPEWMSPNPKDLAKSPELDEILTPESVSCLSPEIVDADSPFVITRGSHVLFD